ncbi:hypothetical protein P3X46_029359 [Hevea brasiliensis]|uniref:YchF C-terminal domain-containing protein n=1 Tax=Hevea brasiliensis TaxID=3981 RepID=A0ABQ9KVC0_HEVBR|nr:hypothetical protein P3X46_029359 [Hevea brasiliensis]
MPPKSAKSKEAPAQRPILGRFSSHLKIGILSCTIEPNEARVNITDERFEWLCQLYKPKSEVWQGLGNNFLSHIHAVDGIFHVLHPDIIHVDDFVNPVRDLEVIGDELRLKDIEFMERRVEDLEKSMKRSNDKQLKIDHESCQRVNACLEDGKDVRLGDWKAADIEILNTFQLLTAKPVVYLNKFLPKIHAWVQEHGAEPIIPFSCVLERNLADMSPDEAAKYCKENKVQSALPKIIKTGFSAINLIYFFTTGPDEVMKFDDLKELGSEAAVKEGKTYVVQDGDIIFFKFNVSGGGKK